MRSRRLIAARRRGAHRIREAAYQQLHRDPTARTWRTILARVPTDLDALTQSRRERVPRASGFRVERIARASRFAIEFGNDALVDSLPGVPGGSSFVGTFDREEAVEDETIDFFASGHPLVEGLLAHYEDDPKGRVARLEVRIPAARRRRDRVLQGRPRNRDRRVRCRRTPPPGLARRVRSRPRGRCG